jgi:transcriptional regulator of acetoin/glycerol metabolism
MDTRVAWERFQSGEGQDDRGSTVEVLDVRREILTSWRRSRLSGVDPVRLDVPHEDIDLDSRFARAARPVLDESTERMVGTGMCLAVTDRVGRVLWSWGPDRARRRRLDELALLQGFRFDEETAGTNGLGTALEADRIVTVSGEEHFKEVFHPFACVAAPVHDPVTGRAVGAVNVTCRPSELHPLLSAAVLTMVRDVREELLAMSGERERRLLDIFLAEPARRAAPVITLSRDVLIANDAAAELRLDHRRLWSRVLDSSDGGTVDLPGRDGHRASVRVIAEQHRITGAVLVVDEHRRSPDTIASDVTKTVVEAVERAGAAILRGESGTGKRHLARRVLAGPPAEVDAADIVTAGLGEWCRLLGGALEQPAPVLLSHLETIDQNAIPGVASVLGRPRRGHLVGTWVASGATSPGRLCGLLDAIGGPVVDVAPLRNRPGDIAALARAAVDPPQALLPEVADLLTDHHWPGNIAELHHEVRTAAAAAGQGPIRPEHLPAYLRAGRRLSPLERAEVGVIAETLAASDGNKTEAARRLGITRPTLYARMRMYRL